MWRNGVKLWGYKLPCDVAGIMDTPKRPPDILQTHLIGKPLSMKRASDHLNVETARFKTLLFLSSNIHCLIFQSLSNHVYRKWLGAALPWEPHQLMSSSNRFPCLCLSNRHPNPRRCVFHSVSERIVIRGASSRSLIGL